MNPAQMQPQFPLVRLRRLRQSQALRDLTAQTRLHPSDLIAPVFVAEAPEAAKEGTVAKQFDLKDLLPYLERFASKGGKAVLLFGVPGEKDSKASQAYAENGIVQRSLREIKKQFGDSLAVAVDLCFCSYTDHGHCGILERTSVPAYESMSVATVDNDATLEIIAKTALSQAQAGADIIAPSGMMDGQIKTIRESLDKGGFKDTVIMSYAAKYASTLYGPFRDVADSAPSFGNRKTYQMNPANAREALREMDLDFAEGADILMVKPAIFYLDILSQARARFNCPLAAYQVSGEAWMIEQYAKTGMAKREDAILESIIAIKRAGANLIITYFANDLLTLL